MAEEQTNEQAQGASEQAGHSSQSDHSSQSGQAGQPGQPGKVWGLNPNKSRRLERRGIFGRSTSRRPSRRRHHHHHRSRRRSGGRARWPFVVGGVVAVLLVTIAVCGLLLYRSLGSVMSEARDAKGQVSAISASLMSGDGAALHAATDKVSKAVDSIQKEVHGPLWSVATVVPVVGRDVSNAQKLSDSASNLVHGVLEPVVDDVAGTKLSDLVQKRRIDTAMLKSLRGTIVGVSPTLVSTAEELSGLEHGSIGRINELIDTLAEPMGLLSSLLKDADGLFATVLGMLGDGGQTRTYVLIAQGNSEIKAAGGFMGSVGMVTVTDGNIELGEFHGVGDYKNRVVEAGYVPFLLEDEYLAFGDVLALDAAGSTLTPNFVRVGELTSDLWGHAYDVGVDGVVGLDPVFLQRVLRIIGGIVAEDGTEVNGDNAAYELLSNVYWRYGYEPNGNELEDAFFNDVAQRSFSKLLDSMGDFEFAQFGELWDAILRSGDDRRFQVWMKNEGEQRFMSSYDLAGELQSDVSKPELGVYADDNTWAKLAWYLDITADLGQATKNADGTSTYHVTAHFRNSITEKEAEGAPGYVTGGQPLKRAKSDLVETVYVMAPLGAKIADYQVHFDAPMPEDRLVPDEHLTLYGHDTMRSRINVLGGGDTTITFTLTLPAEATEPIRVRTSPLCHE